MMSQSAIVNGGPDDTPFARCADLADIVSTTLDRALAIADTRMGNIQLIQWGHDPTLEIVAQRGFGEEFLSCFRSVSMTDPSACGRALTSRETVVIDDILGDDDYAPFRGVALRAGYRSVQSTLLMSSGGAVYGVLSTHAAQPGRPDRQQLAGLQELARNAADAITRLRARAEAPEPQAAL
jgi:GAF domain-containing protein